MQKLKKAAKNKTAKKTTKKKPTKSKKTAKKKAKRTRKPKTAYANLELEGQICMVEYDKNDNEICREKFDGHTVLQIVMMFMEDAIKDALDRLKKDEKGELAKLRKALKNA
jgi:hypothetical protein